MLHWVFVVSIHEANIEPWSAKHSAFLILRFSSDLPYAELTGLYLTRPTESDEAVLIGQGTIAALLRRFI